MKFLNDESIDYISEAIYNLLYNENLKTAISKKQKNKKIKIIQPNPKNFEIISKRHIPIIKRKKKIVPVGSGIGMVLATLIPMISSLLTTSSSRK